MASMTREAIVASCKANGGYAAPEMNESLYLHCKGYAAIDNLDAYTNVKVLWLEQNAIEQLSGLTRQQQLVSLFVQNNTIRSLTTFSAPLRNLRVLNVSYNYLTSLDGLAVSCPLLETLQASHNHVASLRACADLHALAGTLTSIDLSYNKLASDNDDDDDGDNECNSNAHTRSVVARPVHDIADEVRVVDVCGSKHDDDNDKDSTNAATASAPTATPDMPLPALVRFFAQMPLVSMLCLHGNPLTQSMRQYRRRMLQHLPALTYLDERPVFDEERRVVRAWADGGAAAETAERAAIRAEKRAHLTSCVRVLHERMQANRDVRDRLVQQWDAQRAAELAATVQRRRNDAAARADVDVCESQARVLLVDDEAAAWRALCARAEDDLALAARQRDEAARAAHDVVVADVPREVDAEEALAAAAATTAEGGDDDDDTTRHATLCELVKSDDDVLRELEDEMQAVLGDVDAHVARCRADASHGGAAAAAVAGMYDRTTGRAERAMHAAVSHVSAKLRGDRGDRAAAQRRELWRQFDAWQQQQQSAASAVRH